MAQVINTNFLSLTSQARLNRSQGKLAAAIGRLSSGSRINSAKDDEAGQAIANRMTATTRGLSQAARNAADGISLAQVTEGALNEINDNVQRVRELTVQALNGTNSADDIRAVKEEVNQCMAEIDRVSAQTQFNGLHPLAEDSSLTLQVGANDNECISLDTRNTDCESLGLQGFVPEQQDAVWQGDHIDIADFKDAHGQSAVKPEVTAPPGVTWNTTPLAVNIYKVNDKKGNVAADRYYAQVAVKDGTPNGRFTYMEISLQRVASDGRDMVAYFQAEREITVLPPGAPAPDGPLKQIDHALTQIDTQRSRLGAAMARMGSTISDLNCAVNNQSAARSRISDADYAAETAAKVSNQILLRSGTAVLAHANHIPKRIMKLLR